jgi:1-aminocyclopropane-1-carboxylate deaminase/D-cysteine desulfhydrase-like pyridoxal-dependent ACC family enzyme
LYVKRDDLMPIGLGGNKLRSLEYWLGAALAEHAEVVLVAGTANSNLCRLTAAAASMAGLECIVLHNAEDDPAARRASYLCRIFGASVRYLGEVEESQRARALEKLAGELKTKGCRPYIVGDPALGALGYVRAARELHAQCAQQGFPIRHVLLPGSMGTTEAGFLVGNALLDHPFEVHLASVEYPQAELSARVREIFRDAATLIGAATLPLNEDHIHYHMNQLGAGYACPTSESEAALVRFARTEGLVLEHVYTAKTFACFLEMAGGATVPATEGLCVVHTGGIPALFAQFEWSQGIPLERD